MKMRCLRAIVPVLALATVLLATPDARAACGEGLPCRCGDLVQGRAVLDGDLSDCKGVGIRLGEGAMLDCAGHAIRGLGIPESKEGVRLNGVSGATVRGCRISGFHRGVRIRGGRDNRVTGNHLHDNGHGLEISGLTNAGHATGHLVLGNDIEASVQDGVHIGTGAEEIVIADNRIRASAQEGIYLQWCERCSAVGNVVEGSGTSPLYVKHSSDGRYLDNVLSDSMVQVRGDSARNLFARNVLHRSSFGFEAYVGRGYGRDTDWIARPRENEVVGGAIAARKYCFRFEGAENNEVRDVLAIECRATRPGEEPAGNLVAMRETTGDLDGDRIEDAIDACTDQDGDGFGEPGFPASRCASDDRPTPTATGSATLATRARSPPTRAIATAMATGSATSATAASTETETASGVEPSAHSTTARPSPIPTRAMPTSTAQATSATRARSIRARAWRASRVHRNHSTISPTKLAPASRPGSSPSRASRHPLQASVPSSTARAASSATRNRRSGGRASAR
jgi:hypothetical protein